MPIRLWVFSGVMLLAVVVGYLTLRNVAPADGSATGPGTPVAGAIPRGPEAVPVAATPGEAAAGGAAFPGLAVAGAVGPEGVARVEMPFEVPPGPEPDAAFQAEIDAYAARRQTSLPEVDGITTLDTIEVEGRLIVFNYRIAIDLRAYTLPLDPPQQLTPYITGWICDGNTCIDFHPDFADVPCASDIRPLLDRGAVGVYKYRDLGGLPIGTMTVSTTDCAA